VCIALHYYKSTKSDELDLCPGLTIRVTKKADDGWWFGSSSKGHGWFPQNFTYIPTFPIDPNKPCTYAKVGNILTFNLVYSYKAQEPDELNLQVGDMVAVLPVEEDDGWNKGILRGKVGVFPNNV
jgi:hypothetical protein